MFDAMPHQFLATSTPSPTTSLPFSFSLQNANNFQQQQQQYYQEQQQQQQQRQQQQLYFEDSYDLHHQQQGTNTRNESKEESVVVANSVVIPTCLVQVGSSEPSSSTLMVRDQCVVVAPWSSEEVLCLLKIISSLDSPWFPSQFTWDNVSRKLAEFGFIRSAEICKEKFEEETSNFNNNRHKHHVIGQNYRLFGGLEVLYNNNNNITGNNDNDDDDININNDDDDEGGDYCGDRRDNVNNDLGEHDNKEVEKIGQEKLGNDEDNNDNSVGEEDDRQKRVNDRKKVTRKRKREKKKFEMFKGFCENIVSKMIAQQEEMHSKILEEMVKRDEEKIAKEEAWKKQEIDRMTQVMQVRAHEQAIVGDRQATILGFLKKFSSSSSNNSMLSTSSSILSQDSISATSNNDQNLGLQSPTTNPMSGSQGDLCELVSKSTCKSLRFDDTSTDVTGRVMSFGSPKGQTDSKVIVGDVKDDIGRRWPRDEVLALINIRCNHLSNNGDHRDRESFSKGPLWERISQKMMELGYKRSAKRCKEKWENINKYFRKTKDLNKKRSIDSRTCPYFHQLNHLYNQGTPHGQYDQPTSQHGSSTGNQLMSTLGAHGESNNVPDGATNSKVVPIQENEDVVVQLSNCQVGSILNNFHYSIT